MKCVYFLLISTCEDDVIVYTGTKVRANSPFNPYQVGWVEQNGTCNHRYHAMH